VIPQRGGPNTDLAQGHIGNERSGKAVEILYSLVHQKSHGPVHAASPARPSSISSRQIMEVDELWKS
jgi:hypothetical protein